MEKCLICENVAVQNESVTNYLACSSCGHEIIKNEGSDIFIINDSLIRKNVERIDVLGKYQKKISSKCSYSHEFLLDIGSGSGKFLYHNKDLFENYAGVEVTPECVSFCNKLGLRVVPSLNELAKVERLSLVTFWHSLEHIGITDIHSIISFIKDRSTDSTRIIISVPNAASVLNKTKNYAFSDPASHLHQFTERSLGILLGDYNFKKARSFFSFAYSFFGYLQTYLNFGNLKHNFLYYYLKRGEDFGLSKTKIFLLLAYNIILAAFLSVPALIGCLFDLLNKRRAAILTICYRFKP